MGTSKEGNRKLEATPTTKNIIKHPTKDTFSLLH